MTSATSDEETEPAVDGSSPRRRKPIRWIALIVGVTVFLSTAIVVGGRITHTANSADSPLIGKPAPAFDLARIDAPGRVKSLSLRGSITIINFWASWCVPCRAENARLASFYLRWHPKGVELVGVVYNDTVSSAKGFRNELGGTWPLVEDPHGSTAVDYGVIGVPETFIIDQYGIVVSKLIGAVGPTTLDDILSQIANGAPSVTYTNGADFRQGPGTTG